MMTNKSWKFDKRLIDIDLTNSRLIIFAIIVGVIAGVASSIFRIILSKIENAKLILFSNINTSNLTDWILPISIGIIGTAISIFLVRRFAPEAAGSGIHEIEGALDEVRTLRWKRILPIKFIASIFSLGSGFLLGREGPTIQIGANIGKMVKDIVKEPDSENNPLVSAGAAAGLAGAFNAPLSGIIFVIEEMHGVFKYNFFSVASIMIASGTADFIARILTGGNPAIKMTIYPSPPIYNIWLFILLGIILGIVGYIFNKSIIYALDFFNKLQKKQIIIMVISAGILISVIGILFPNMIGGGYNTIKTVLNQSFTLKILIILFISRFILTILSYGIGLPGGIFAPLVALGVVFGVIYGNIIQYFFPGLIQDVGVFAIAGMSGIFASTIKAPLTGLILAVEMTLNFELLLPLIFTTVTASIITTQLGNKPIYTILLKRILKTSTN